MRETELTVKFCRELEKVGAYTVAFVAGMRSIAGVPDRFISHAALLPGGCFVEFKRHDTPLSEIQRKTIRNMRAGGANVLIVRFTENQDGFNVQTVCPHSGEVEWVNIPERNGACPFAPNVVPIVCDPRSAIQALHAMRYALHVINDVETGS